MRNFCRLPSLERRLLIFSMLLLPVVVLAHRCLGLRRVQIILGVFGSALDGMEAPTPEWATYGLVASRLVSIAGKRGVVRATCLQQSIYLRWLLALRGVESDLRIGVRKRNGRFEAHAWVELLGQALNDSADVSTRFSPFPRGALAPQCSGS